MKNIKYLISVLIFSILLSNAVVGQISLTFSVDTNYICNGNGCSYSGPTILINEVMLTPSTGDGSIFDSDNTRRGEWIELYNPDNCKPADVSCFYLGNNAPDIANYGGGYRIPDHTIVPAGGFLVIRGTNATPVPANLLVQNGGNTLEFLVDNLLGNVCLESGANRLWFPNAGGWFAFYDRNGVPQDAISWCSQTNSCLSCSPCIATCTGCSMVASLPSYDAVPANLKTYITSLNPANYMGSSWRRIPDGGPWSNAAASPTIGNCNSICNPMASITCNGVAIVNPTGGTPPYSYMWNDPQASLVDSAFGLCEGYYTVTVTDANSLQTIDSVYIPNFKPQAVFTTVAPVCLDANSINLSSYATPIGGIFSGAGVTDSTFNPLAGGVGDHLILYDYADEHACTDSATTTIKVNGIPTSTFTVVSPICAMGNSTINYTGNGLASATYTWDFDGGTATPIGGLQNYHVSWFTEGTYTISLIVTQNNCVSSITSHTIVISNLQLNATTTANVSCYSFANGTATVAPLNGLPPYSYHWSTLPVQDTQNITNLPPGIYFVTVTDSLNCTAFDTVTVTQPTLLISSITSTQDATCHGLNNGSATASASEGTSSYTYNWSGGIPNGGSVTGLVAGNYTITVSDSHACDTVLSFTINQPTALTSSITTTHDVICYNDTTGAASVSANNASPPYIYAWSGGNPNGDTVTGLQSGTYFVTVSDSHTCDTVLTFQINNGPQIFLTLLADNEVCPGSCDGSILITTLNGATLPYSYLWSNSATTNTISQLCNGDFTLTITDSNHCKASAQAHVGTDISANANGYANPNNFPTGTLVNFYYTGDTANVTSYTWQFGDGGTANGQFPIHTYEIPDGVNVFTYHDTLTITFGTCADVFIFDVIVYRPSTIFIPNIITPNGDGFNDAFRVKSEGLGMEEMLIYNRWGKKVFTWSQVGGSWDGTDGNREFSDGVYFYIFKADGEGDGKHYDMHGTVTVLK